MTDPHHIAYGWLDDRCALVDLLKSLVHDLSAISAGASPDNLASSTAPTLHRWRVTLGESACMVGEVTGHPLLPGNGRHIATSQLWFVSADKRWARTTSRWYRLGQASPIPAVFS